MHQILLHYPTSCCFLLCPCNLVNSVWNFIFFWVHFCANGYWCHFVLSCVHLLILCVTSLRNFAISFLLSSALWSIVCFHNRWRNQGSGSLTELPSTTQLVGFPGGLNGKESTCNEETWVGSLHWVDPLEKGMATHSSILTWSYSGLYWSIPWTEEPGGLYSMESQRVGHDWATITFTFHTTNRWQAEDFNFCFSDIVSSFWQEVPWSCH